jgi:hypothetical protein
LRIFIYSLAAVLPKTTFISIEVESLFRQEYKMKHLTNLKQLGIATLAGLALGTFSAVAFAQTGGAPATAPNSSNSTMPANGQTGSSGSMSNPGPAGAANNSATGASAVTQPHNTDSGATAPSTATTSNPSALGNKNSISGANPAAAQ